MIDYKQIEKANAEIKATDIKGNDYAKVAERVKAFRKVNPEGSIETEIVSLENGVVVMKATVRNSDGFILGTGTAYEKESSSYINKLSMIENCETSCVGRALGFCGYGIDIEIASAEEVQNVKENVKEAMKEHQAVIEDNASTRAKVLKHINDCKNAKELMDNICKEYKIAKVTDMTDAQAEELASKFFK